MSEVNSQTTVTRTETQTRSFSWVQFGVTMAVSLATSIAVVSWTVSANNTYFTWSIREHDDRIKRIEAIESTSVARLATIEANQIQGQRRGDARDAQLLRIENKVDELVMMFARSNESGNGKRR